MDAKEKPLLQRLTVEPDFPHAAPYPAQAQPNISGAQAPALHAMVAAAGDSNSPLDAERGALWPLPGAPSIARQDL